MRLQALVFAGALLAATAVIVWAQHADREVSVMPQSLNHRIGRNCAVSVRGDYLGMAGNQGNPGEDAMVYLVGTLRAVNEEWIVVETTPQTTKQPGECWVPRAAVLMIKVMPK